MPSCTAPRSQRTPSSSAAAPRAPSSRREVSRRPRTGRRDRPKMYGLTGVHVPLVPRDRRYEVTERLDHTGAVLTPLDEDELRAVARSIAELDVQSVVVSFLHAYANPAHEKRARVILAEVNPNWEIVTATSVVRSTTSSSAPARRSSRPICNRSSRAMRATSRKSSPMGILPRRADHAVERRPRAARRARPALGAHRPLGARGGRRRPRRSRAGPGSTTSSPPTWAAPASTSALIEGQRGVAEDRVSTRMPLRLPMIDVHTIGAGGGSIAAIDRGGVLEVGPRSAGAEPGPSAMVAAARSPRSPTPTSCSAASIRTA